MKQALRDLDSVTMTVIKGKGCKVIVQYCAAPRFESCAVKLPGQDHGIIMLPVGCWPWQSDAKWQWSSYALTSTHKNMSRRLNELCHLCHLPATVLKRQHCAALGPGCGRPAIDEVRQRYLGASRSFL